MTKTYVVSAMLGVMVVFAVYSLGHYIGVLQVTNSIYKAQVTRLEEICKTDMAIMNTYKKGER